MMNTPDWICLICSVIATTFHDAQVDPFETRPAELREPPSEDGHSLYRHA
jgi:hypothetical protein